ncbi:MAG: RpoL/Rpb11 RNA polymerase subunit family protein [Candidatus Micrarchaeia archaeon]
MNVETLKDEEGFLEVKLSGEDLGVASLVVERLLHNKSVAFAGAKLDHPIKGNPVITVKAKNAKKELQKAVSEVAKDMDKLQKELEKAK